MIVVFVLGAAAKSEIAQTVDSKKEVGHLLMIHNENVGKLNTAIDAGGPLK